MADVVESTNRSPEPELATQVARLWPHRECEAHFVLRRFCSVGSHWWRQVDLSELVPGRDIHFVSHAKRENRDGDAHSNLRHECMPRA